VLTNDVMTSRPAAALDDPLEGVTVAVLGGSGPLGRGLAFRWTAAGLRVVVGSRDAGQAQRVADELSTASTDDRVMGLDNAAAAEQADIVVVAVPYDGHWTLLNQLREPLAGKILVDCVNPLGFDKHGAYALAVPAGSAALEAAETLLDTRVTAAFHHVSAVVLTDREVARVETDVLVLADDRDAQATVAALAERIPGVRGIHGGRLRNSHQVEAMTANLISINRRYKAHSGLRVSGLEPTSTQDLATAQLRASHSL
jgi:NADPH-dependent F420 reductase